MSKHCPIVYTVQIFAIVYAFLYVYQMCMDFVVFRSATLRLQGGEARRHPSSFSLLYVYYRYIHP